MADEPLDGLTVAILVTDGFEQIELLDPREAMEEAGAETVLVSPKRTTVRGWQYTDWGNELRVDLPLDEARPRDFDALLLPGGVMSPDTLRTVPRAVSFVKGVFDLERPVAAICHGPWIIIEAGQASGRRVTAWPSLKTDLRNAGALWVDQPVVLDRNLVTSRGPDDIPAFNGEMISLFSRSLLHAR